MFKFLYCLTAVYGVLVGGAYATKQTPNKVCSCKKVVKPKIDHRMR